MKPRHYLGSIGIFVGATLLLLSTPLTPMVDVLTYVGIILVGTLFVLPRPRNPYGPE